MDERSKNDPPNITFMRAALDEARAAMKHDDVPIGAVVVMNGQIIGRGHNQREVLHDPTAHAEVVALRAAAKHMNTWHLENATMYVTLEPCAMCAGACVNARLGRVVYGATDPKAGAAESLYQLTTDSRLNHQVRSDSGVLAQECAELLRCFFRERRKPSSSASPTN